MDLDADTDTDVVFKDPAQNNRGQSKEKILVILALRFYVQINNICPAIFDKTYLKFFNCFLFTYRIYYL